MPRWTVHDENDRVMLLEVTSEGISVHIPASGPPLILDIESAQALRTYLGAAIREARRDQS